MNQSHESLYVDSLGGRVTVRGLTAPEAALREGAARRKARGDRDALRWLLLVGSLSLGLVEPRLTRKGAEMYAKTHAPDAARLVTRIMEKTNRRNQ